MKKVQYGMIKLFKGMTKDNDMIKHSVQYDEAMTKVAKTLKKYDEGIKKHGAGRAKV